MMRFPAGTTFAPYSVLRNVSDQAISVTPGFYWMQAGAAHSAKLAPIALAPRASFTLDLAAALQGAGLGNYSGAMSVILDVQGPLYSLLAAAVSIRRTLTCLG